MVVAAGLAVGFFIAGSLSPAKGAQLYVYPGSPPVTITSRMLCEVGHVPMFGSLAVAVADRTGATVIVSDAVAVQPLLSVTRTVYVVVTAGFAVGVALVASSRVPALSHRYVYPGSPPEALAVSSASDPGQVPML